MSIMSDDKDAVEEERRLCYVGITRAREKLTLTMARQRMTNGETRYSRASRFVEEIPAWLLEQEEQPSVFGRAAGRSWGGSPSASSSDRGFGDAASSSWGGAGSGVQGSSANRSWGRSGGITTGWGAASGGGATASGFGSTAGNRQGEGVSTFGGKPNAYASKTAPAASSFGKAFSVQKADHLPYSEGERVKHVKFGEGTVKKIEDGGKDFEVTVEFDRVGVKKMFASFAKLLKV